MADNNYLEMAKAAFDSPYAEHGAVDRVQALTLLSIAQDLHRLADQGDAQVETLEKFRNDRRVRDHG